MTPRRPPGPWCSTKTTASTTCTPVQATSTTSLSRHLDRHWRNARTLAAHNPVSYRLRTVGDHVVIGNGLNFFWATGEAPTG